MNRPDYDFILKQKNRIIYRLRKKGVDKDGKLNEELFFY